MYLFLAAGKEGLPTPGLGIGVGASISARRQEKLGMSEGQRAAALKAKEIKGEYDKAKEKFDKDKFEDFQAANDQFAKDFADIARKYGKEAAEAALK